VLTVAGYTIQNLIHETPSGEVYTGVRSADGLHVVIKLYLGDVADARTRAEHEFELFRRIDHPGVARPLELSSIGEHPMLVLECSSGRLLASYLEGPRPSLGDFLKIALGLAQSLAAVHAARVIHKDVTPRNIWVDPDQLTPCLIDFGIAVEFGRAERSAPPEMVEGTWHYIAPEQTGRMGRGIDFRTDLYTLGASLYHLLTSRTPFHTKHGVELMSAHVAQRAPSVAQLCPRVPQALSRMLEKLLEKDPELRYQTARGLAADLETCIKQLHESGEIDDELALGLHDASDRLRFPNRLYGREREAEELSAALARTTQNAVELVLIAGPPGIGKSSLAGVLRERLAATGGYLAEAKFELDQSDRPYSGFAAAINSFADQILAESGERVAMWSDRIRQGLGSLGRLVVDLAPYLEALVHDFPKLHASDTQEAGERLALAVNRFIAAVARPEHPLVLFLDDLQWADAGSLFLLGSLLRSSEPEGLLVIGGYRTAEVSPEHPFAVLLDQLAGSSLPIRRFELAPLTLEDTSQLLSDTLGRPLEDTRELAKRIQRKTQNNPLLVRRMLFRLWQRDLLRYEHGQGWVWQEQGFHEIEMTDDAASLLAARIDDLSPQARELIQIASVMGSAFELELLVALAEVPRLDGLHEMMSLTEQGLIEPSRDGFKFAHDRIRESARDSLDAEAREALHYRIALRLLEQSTPEQRASRVFEIADHLRRSGSRIPEQMRYRALEIAAAAGDAALRTGAPVSASQYLTFARSLVRDEDWDKGRAQTVALFLSSSRCAYQRKDFEAGFSLLEDLERHDPGPDDQIRIDVQRIKLATASRPTRETLDLSLETLRRYGVRWSRRPSLLRVRFAIWRTDWMLRGPYEKWPLRPAPRGDLRWLYPIMIKAAAAQVHSLTNVRLVCLTGSDTLRAYVEHGYARSPGLSIATYAAWRCSVLRHSGGLERYVHAAASWNARVPDPVFGPKADYVIEAFAKVWIQPRRSVLAPLARLAQRLHEAGEVEYATNALYWRCVPLALSGLPLDETLREFEGLPRWLGMDRPAQAERLAEPFRRLAAPGSRSPEDPLPHIEQLLAEFEGSSACPPFVTMWMLYLCVFSRFEDALRISEPVRELVFDVHSTPHVADYTFYRGLAAGVVAQRASGAPRRRLRRVLWGSIRQLEVWARHGPDFVHMALLLRAESQALRGRDTQALHDYRMAATRAAQVEYPHHAALAHERRATLLLTQRRQTAADAERVSAHARYQDWGAIAKLEQLASDA